LPGGLNAQIVRQDEGNEAGAQGCPVRTRAEPERHAFRPLQPIGDDRDANLVNRFFTLLGHRPVMPQAAVGIRPPAENLERRTDSQDLMDHAQDIRKKLRER
jgi:hypothetical protein